MFRYIINYFTLFKYLFYFKKKDIVFYSDGIENDPHIFDLLKRLHNLNKNIIYLYSSINDNISKQKFIRKKSFFIGKNLRILFLNLLNAKILITTANDLNLFYIKRSPFVKKYVYTFHSLISTHMGYLEESFDYYDVILCASSYHLDEIEKREKLFQIKTKEKIELGYANLLNIENINKKKISKKINNNNYYYYTILIAPSWSKNGIDDVCINNILKILLSNKFNVIYRPHSYKYKLNKKFFDNLVKIYNNNFYLDLNFNSYESFYKSNLMISDWGGVSLEYSILRKPIIYINTEPKIRNKNYKKLDITPFEIMIRSEIGQIIELENINKINEYCMKLLNTNYNKNKNIKKYIFNYNKNIDYVISYIHNIAEI